jgi:hypothetical protein
VGAGSSHFVTVVLDVIGAWLIRWTSKVPPWATCHPPAAWQRMANPHPAQSWTGQQLQTACQRCRPCHRPGCRLRGNAQGAWGGAPLSPSAPHPHTMRPKKWEKGDAGMQRGAMAAWAGGSRVMQGCRGYRLEDPVGIGAYRLELPTRRPWPQVLLPRITLSGAFAEALSATRAAGLALMPVARLAVGLRREIRCPLHPSCRSRLGPADGLA